MTSHIFISYAKKDTKPLASQLYAALRAVDGLTAWMDETLETGRSWARQIQREIDRADFVLVLLSPDVNREETPCAVSVTWGNGRLAAVAQYFTT